MLFVFLLCLWFLDFPFRLFSKNVICDEDKNQISNRPQFQIMPPSPVFDALVNIVFWEQENQDSDDDEEDKENALGSAHTHSGKPFKIQHVF